MCTVCDILINRENVHFSTEIFVRIVEFWMYIKFLLIDSISWQLLRWSSIVSKEIRYALFCPFSRQVTCERSALYYTMLFFSASSLPIEFFKKRMVLSKFLCNNCIFTIYSKYTAFFFCNPIKFDFLSNHWSLQYSEVKIVLRFLYRRVAVTRYQMICLGLLNLSK